MIYPYMDEKQNLQLRDWYKYLKSRLKICLKIVFLY